VDSGAVTITGFNPRKPGEQSCLTSFPLFASVHNEAALSVETHKKYGAHFPPFGWALA
jgi:hypothetical protein